MRFPCPFQIVTIDKGNKYDLFHVTNSDGQQVPFAQHDMHSPKKAAWCPISFCRTRSTRQQKTTDAIKNKKPSTRGETLEPQRDDQAAKYIPTRANDAPP